MRYAEYCQQIDHLKMSVEEIKEVLDDKNIRYAYLVHDKDILEDGSPKPSHLHVMLDFRGASWTPDSLCKWFKDEPERIEKPKTKKNRFVYENMCSYLVHETETADGKYHYADTDVVANFNFIEFMEQIRKGVLEAKANKKVHPLADVLDKIMKNEIPRIKLDEYIDDLTHLKYLKDIDNAYKIRDTKLAKETDRSMNVMYLFGASGTGKTTWAKVLAKQKGYSVFVSGSSNDPLEGYMGQECIILDDIRGSDWKINDLLKMLDNNTNSLVKSRYNNKLLNDCKLMILTSVQSIEDLYSNLKEHESEPIEQLKRRCTDMIEFTSTSMNMFTYNPELKEYENKGSIPNMTSQLLYLAEHKDSLINDIKSLADSLQKEPW